MRAVLLLALALASGRASSQAPRVPESFTRPDRGHCIACHQLPDSVGPPTRASLGPALTGARMRELRREGIREAIADPTRANPDTVMPPFGKHRILDAAEIDRLVEFLHALP